MPSSHSADSSIQLFYVPSNRNSERDLLPYPYDRSETEADSDDDHSPAPRQAQPENSGQIEIHDRQGVHRYSVRSGEVLDVDIGPPCATHSAPAPAPSHPRPSRQADMARYEELRARHLVVARRGGPLPGLLGDSAEMGTDNTHGAETALVPFSQSQTRHRGEHSGDASHRSESEADRTLASTDSPRAASEGPRHPRTDMLSSTDSPDDALTARAGAPTSNRQEEGYVRPRVDVTISPTAPTARRARMHLEPWGPPAAFGPSMLQGSFTYPHASDAYPTIVNDQRPSPGCVPPRSWSATMSTEPWTTSFLPGPCTSCGLAMNRANDECGAYHFIPIHRS